MIELEIYQRTDDYLKNIYAADNPKYVYLDETTISVDHYEKGVTSDQLDQTIKLIHKVIDNIYNMRLRTDPMLEGRIDNVDLTISGGYVWVRFHLYERDYLKFWCHMSYDDFKKLLISQHKENEIAYLMLKGVMK